MFYLQGDVEAAVKILLSLKADYKNVTGQDWKPAVAPSAAGQKTAGNKGGNNKSGQSRGMENSQEAGEVNAEIQKQGNIVRELKSKKADKVGFSASPSVARVYMT